MKIRTSKYRDRKFFAGGFSFVELQIAMVILAIGLWGFAGLFKVYSRQTDYIEQSSMPVSTYYIVSQSNKWMKRLGTPAEMEQTAGGEAWEPDVNDNRTYSIQLNSYSKDFNLRRESANVVTWRYY